MIPQVKLAKQEIFTPPNTSSHFLYLWHRWPLGMEIESHNIIQWHSSCRTSNFLTDYVYWVFPSLFSVRCSQNQPDIRTGQMVPSVGGSRLYGRRNDDVCCLAGKIAHDYFTNQVHVLVLAIMATGIKPQLWNCIGNLAWTRTPCFEFNHYTTAAPSKSRFILNAVQVPVANSRSS